MQHNFNFYQAEIAEAYHRMTTYLQRKGGRYTCCPGRLSMSPDNDRHLRLEELHLE